MVLKNISIRKKAVICHWMFNKIVLDKQNVVYVPLSFLFPTSFSYKITQEVQSNELILS